MKAYIPRTLPIDPLDATRLLPLVGRANAALARYDGLLQAIPEPEIVLSQLGLREAVLSSKIEGTQATVDQVLEQEAGLSYSGSRYDDIVEINNYRDALAASREYLIERPIRLSFVRSLHEILMRGARGHNKSPGKFRLEQNWIGRPGCTIENATFVPPSPLQLVNDLEAWERYLESNDLDVLIQAAVVHAQFELLHPFQDGNGRIGRLLIPLFLFHKRALSQPMFYLSEYLENHRNDYYERLQAISSDDDWDGWIEFFLRAVEAQAEANIRQTRAIRTLYDDLKLRLPQLVSSPFAIHVLDALFTRPTFSISTLSKEISDTTGANEKTIATLIRRLRDNDVLREKRPAAGRRAAIMTFPALLDLLRTT